MGNRDVRIVSEKSNGAFRDWNCPNCGRTLKNVLRKEGDFYIVYRAMFCSGLEKGVLCSSDKNYFCSPSCLRSYALEDGRNLGGGYDINVLDLPVVSKGDAERENRKETVKKVVNFLGKKRSKSSDDDYDDEDENDEEVSLSASQLMPQGPSREELAFNALDMDDKALVDSILGGSFSPTEAKNLRIEAEETKISIMQRYLDEKHKNNFNERVKEYFDCFIPEIQLSILNAKLPKNEFYSPYVRKEEKARENIKAGLEHIVKYEHEFSQKELNLYTTEKENPIFEGIDFDDLINNTNTILYRRLFYILDPIKEIYTTNKTMSGIMCGIFGVFALIATIIFGFLGIIPGLLISLAIVIVCAAIIILTVCKNSFSKYVRDEYKKGMHVVRPETEILDNMVESNIKYVNKKVLNVFASYLHTSRFLKEVNEDKIDFKEKNIKNVNSFKIDLQMKLEKNKKIFGFLSVLSVFAIVCIFSIFASIRSCVSDSMNDIRTNLEEAKYIREANRKEKEEEKEFLKTQVSEYSIVVPGDEIQVSGSYEGLLKFDEDGIIITADPKTLSISVTLNVIAIKDINSFISTEKEKIHADWENYSEEWNSSYYTIGSVKFELVRAGKKNTFVLDEINSMKINEKKSISYSFENPYLSNKPTKEEKASAKEYINNLISQDSYNFDSKVSYVFYHKDADGKYVKKDSGGNDSRNLVINKK